MFDPLWFVRQFFEVARERIITLRNLRIASLAFAVGYVLSFAFSFAEGCPQPAFGVVAVLFLIPATLAQVGLARGER